MEQPIASAPVSTEHHGPILLCVQATLAKCASPLAKVADWFTLKGSSVARIDIFQLACLSISVIILSAAPAKWWPLAAWPIIRLIDIQSVYVNVFVKGDPPRSKPRAVIFLFMHYTEVILLFAALYVIVQAIAPDSDKLFIRNPTGPATLTAAQSVFFSFVTAATIGFGDIAPNHSAVSSWLYVIYVLTWLKAMTIAWLTLVELSRVVGSNVRDAAP